MTLLLKQTEPEWVALHRIADSLEPELQAAFLKALEALKRQLPLNALTDMLEVGLLTDLGELVANLKLPDSVVATLRQVMTSAAVQAGTFTGAALGMSFSLDNPAVLRWVDSQVGRHIVGITSETQLAVRDVIRSAFVEGMHPREQARLIRDVVGLTVRDEGAVARFKQGLLDSGTTLKRTNQLTNRMANRLRRNRAEAIARTETISAANQGQREAWNEAADQRLIDPAATRIVWIATDDARTCPICNELDGTTVGFQDTFPVNQAAIKVGRPKSVFADHDGRTPPAHVMCRCALGLEFDE